MIKLVPALDSKYRVFMDKSFQHKNKHNICAQPLADLMYVNSCTWTSSSALEHATYLLRSSTSSPIISPSSVNYTTICKQVLVPLCVSRAHNLHFFYLMSVSSRFPVNCITRQLSKSDYIPSSKRGAFSSCPFFLVLVLNGGRWKREKDRGKKKKKERSWVMDALCLSVIPNYWTLPFKASLHFSFLPFWLMKSRLWLGALCFKHCLARLSAFASVTIRHVARSRSAMHSNFPHLFFSCSVIMCIVSPFSGMLKKKNYISWLHNL